MSELTLFEYKCFKAHELQNLWKEKGQEFMNVYAGDRVCVKWRENCGWGGLCGVTVVYGNPMYGVAISRYPDDELNWCYWNGGEPRLLMDREGIEEVFWLPTADALERIAIDNLILGEDEHVIISGWPEKKMEELFLDLIMKLEYQKVWKVNEWVTVEE